MIIRNSITSAAILFAIATTTSAAEQQAAVHEACIEIIKIEEFHRLDAMRTELQRETSEIKTKLATLTNKKPQILRAISDLEGVNKRLAEFENKETLTPDEESCKRIFAAPRTSCGSHPKVEPSRIWRMISRNSRTSFPGTNRSYCV
jgi:hypothetical protein